MFDRELVIEILNQILNATRKITVRFDPINDIEDFTNTPEGMEKLDAICMQLIAIGESLKNIDKITSNVLLPRYPEIDWKGAKAMRDIITHHYFDIDSEVVYDVCENKISPLSKSIEKIISDLNHSK